MNYSITVTGSKASLRKYLSLSILLLLPLQQLLAQQIPSLNYPLYQEVVTRFFKNYSIPEKDNASKLRFEKRKDGWHAVEILYNPDEKIITDFLFWNVKKEKYQSLSLPNATKESIGLTDKFLQNRFEIQYYNISPYFGYPGWEKDQIDELKDNTNLNDSALFGLGRAYSVYATNLLNDNAGYKNLPYKFKLGEIPNALSKEQLEEYTAYRNKAISCFKKLEQQNPDYKTIVGSIHEKLSNEYMTGFLEMRVYQNEEEAKKWLADGLYSPFQLSTAKNIFLNCPTNAILFTNGDNDTYPLLYLQEKMGYRKDVLIVNYSLFQNADYADAMKRKSGTAQPLCCSFTPAENKDRLMDVILLKKEDKKTIPFTEAMSTLRSRKNYEYRGDVQYLFFPGNKFSFQWTDSTVMIAEIDRSYLRRNDITVMDVISCALNNRPVCFDVTIEEDAFQQLNDYLELRGFVYTLVPRKKKIKDNEIGYFNADSLYNDFMNNFKIEEPQFACNSENGIVRNYRVLYNRLASELLYQNRNDDAEDVLKKIISIFPDETFPYDISMLDLMENFYKLRKGDAAKNIGEKVIANINSGKLKTVYNAFKISDNERATLTWIKTNAEKNHQQELAEKAGKALVGFRE